MAYKKKTNNPRMGRPKIVWNDNQYSILEGLCQIQATVEEITAVLNTDYKTIDRLCKEHYTDDKGKKMTFSNVYKKYSKAGKISLRRNQFELSKKNTAMAIFLGKQYLGQRDNIETAIPDTNINIVVTPATAEDIGTD